MASCDLSCSHLSPLGFVHQNLAAIPVGIVPEAAPRLVFAVEHPSALKRIAVHITQFLYSLLLAEEHQVVEAAPPDVPRLKSRVPQLALPGRAVSEAGETDDG
jgi:hypothetical protein